MGTVESKGRDLAVRIVNLYRYLTSVKRDYVISKQILRSGTSIGANIVEAQCGQSKKDFISKMYIAFKESAETLYWLDILYRTDYLTQEQYDSLKNDCSEINKMLSAITKTSRQNVTEINTDNR